jgi:hypothetical protein
MPLLALGKTNKSGGGAAQKTVLGEKEGRSAQPERRMIGTVKRLDAKFGLVLNPWQETRGAENRNS